MKNSNEALEKLKAVLKDKGMKYTEQRALILKLLMKIDGHLNAEELYEVVKKEYPEQNIGIATVYRTLNFLEEVELISSISFGKEGKKYESNDTEHHDHIICTSCGKILEFFDEQIEKRQEVIARQNGFMITDHNMQLYGLCGSCKEK